MDGRKRTGSGDRDQIMGFQDDLKGRVWVASTNPIRSCMSAAIHPSAVSASSHLLTPPPVATSSSP